MSYYRTTRRAKFVLVHADPDCAMFPDESTEEPPVPCLCVPDDELEQAIGSGPLADHAVGISREVRKMMRQEHTRVRLLDGPPEELVAEIEAMFAREFPEIGEDTATRLLLELLFVLFPEARDRLLARERDDA